MPSTNQISLEQLFAAYLAELEKYCANDDKISQAVIEQNIYQSKNDPKKHVGYKELEEDQFWNKKEEDLKGQAFANQQRLIAAVKRFKTNNEPPQAEAFALACIDFSAGSSATVKYLPQLPSKEVKAAFEMLRVVVLRDLTQMQPLQKDFSLIRKNLANLKEDPNKRAAFIKSAKRAAEFDGHLESMIHSLSSFKNSMPESEKVLANQVYAAIDHYRSMQGTLLKLDEELQALEKQMQEEQGAKKKACHHYLDPFKKAVAKELALQEPLIYKLKIQLAKIERYSLAPEQNKIVNQSIKKQLEESIQEYRNTKDLLSLSNKIQGLILEARENSLVPQKGLFHRWLSKPQLSAHLENIGAMLQAEGRKQGIKLTFDPSPARRSLLSRFSSLSFRRKPVVSENQEAKNDLPLSPKKPGA